MSNPISNFIEDDDAPRSKVVMALMEYAKELEIENKTLKHDLDFFRKFVNAGKIKTKMTAKEMKRWLLVNRN